MRILKQLPHTTSLYRKYIIHGINHLVDPIECVKEIRPQFIQVEVAIDLVTEVFLIDTLIKAL